MPRFSFMFLSQITPTVVFETYWRFAAERHAIYLKRLRGEPPPWTDNPILQRWKFTNAFRAADRVSQYLIKEVIYNPAYPATPTEYVFRILYYKLFNSIPAWEVLTKAFGVLTWEEFDFEAHRRVLGEAWNTGVDIWNIAYVQNQNVHTEFRYKYERYLALLQEIMEDGIANKLQAARTYEQAFRVLQKYPLHQKGFISMQHLTDINYSPVINFDENEFITPGPGCLNGMQKCFTPLTAGSPYLPRPMSDLQAQAIIQQLVVDQEDHFRVNGLDPVTLFGRKLTAIDIQNLFCECDKYARKAHPEFNIIRDRETGEKYERIKQPFEVTGPLPQPFFPPKWGLVAGVITA
jgi:hypothetical protein